MKNLVLALALVLSAPSAFASYYWASCSCTDGQREIGPTFGADFSAQGALQYATDMCTAAGGTVGKCEVDSRDGGQ